MTPLDQDRSSGGSVGSAAAPGRVIVDPQVEGWPEAAWEALEDETRRRVLAAAGEAAAWQALTRSAWRVIRAFTTSFFLASRFLPAAKRRRVDVIYAAVRYPDEVVDSFPLTPQQRLARLDAWARAYEAALAARSLRAAVEAGVPWPLAGFARLVEEAEIPPQHYRAFLAAMRLDVHPRPFTDLADLVDSYVYGSAVVVGYFLAHVYGASAPGEMERALAASRQLGVALQLTNFFRDVEEDHRRGRVYLPADELAREGIGELELSRPGHRRGVVRVLRRLAAVADAAYGQALADLDAFAPDVRGAIGACIDVYRRLNDRIAAGGEEVLERQSVPALEKFRALPPSKYWRLPLAYLGAL